MNKKYYAGHSYLGTNFSYDASCWTVYAFNSSAERNTWIDRCEYNNQGNLVAEVISRKIAYKITGLTNKNKAAVIDGNNRLMAEWR